MLDLLRCHPKVKMCHHKKINTNSMGYLGFRNGTHPFPFPEYDDVFQLERTTD